jgi:hypothetical protein
MEKRIAEIGMAIAFYRKWGYINACSFWNCSKFTSGFPLPGKSDGDAMNEPREEVCSDPSEEITLRIPCALASRVAAYASAHQTTVSSVVIEALDYFLRHPETA